MTPHVNFTNWAGILKGLENNADDLVLMGKVPRDINVTDHAFLKNRLVVVAAPSNPLVGRKKFL